MWTHVARRVHTPIKIFPFGADASDLMLYGTVAYELHDGRKTEIDWAARAKLVKEEGKWRFVLYQVYLVSYIVMTEVDGLDNDGIGSYGVAECEVSRW